MYRLSCHCYDISTRSTAVLRHASRCPSQGLACGTAMFCFVFLPPVMSLSKDFFQKNVDVSVSKTFKHPVLRNYKTWLRAGATHVGQSWTFQPSDGGFLSLFSSSVALIASEKSCTSYLKTSMSFLFKPSLHWVCSFHRATLERTTEPKICSCVLSHKN